MFTSPRINSKYTYRVPKDPRIYLKQQIQQLPLKSGSWQACSIGSTWKFCLLRNASMSTNVDNYPAETGLRSLSISPP
ncbi:hypothetical protein Y1Q_0009513 [Alligator mississippiensis]|uniref:Uncharacterized protein n=1 Tax=Alligator mississippiensis TaxID=8496 RepID=A0A151NUK9_ALLMI|nr:hypothetical protein Y1Q_0009513 [Alligator mississippiensis]